MYGIWKIFVVTCEKKSLFFGIFIEYSIVIIPMVMI